MEATIKKFNRQQFDKDVNQADFNNFLSECTISMDGKDGFYTRNDAFKSGIMIAYYLLKKSNPVEPKRGEYLGEHKICPNSADIVVECYGNSYPAQRQTLEQEGFSSYVEIENVLHNGIDITDYLSDNDLSDLNERCNKLNNDI